MRLKIGRLAEETGTNTPTIRYYESIGLLPAPDRQRGGQRSYGTDDIKRLTFIRRCRDFGFPIEQVRTLVELISDPARSCSEVRNLAKGQLAAVRLKRVELEQLEASMAEFVERCENACAGGPGPDCVILEDLQDPAPKSQGGCKC